MILTYPEFVGLGNKENLAKLKSPLDKAVPWAKSPGVSSVTTIQDVVVSSYSREYPAGVSAWFSETPISTEAKPIAGPSPALAITPSYERN